MIIKVERCDKRFRLIYRNFDRNYIEFVTNPLNDKWDNNFAKQAKNCFVYNYNLKRKSIRFNLVN